MEVHWSLNFNYSKTQCGNQQSSPRTFTFKFKTSKNDRETVLYIWIQKRILDCQWVNNEHICNVYSVQAENKETFTRVKTRIVLGLDAWFGDDCYPPRRVKSWKIIFVLTVKGERHPPSLVAKMDCKIPIFHWYWFFTAQLEMWLQNIC
jgi:hypothetical protein